MAPRAAGVQVSLDAVPRPVNTAAVRPAEGSLRLVRSAVAGLVCMVTAALGHVAGGGVIPTSTALAAFGGATLIAWLLSSHRLTGGQLVGLLVLCQVGVHLGSATSSMSMSAPMVATHVLATAASAILLMRGEALVWQVTERLGLRAVPMLAAVLTAPLPLHAVVVLRTRVLTKILLAHSRIERGPPIAS